MKYLNICLLVLSFAFISKTHAQVLSATCSLDFEAKGTDIQILIGYSKLVGRGEITCVDNTGKQEKLKIKVTVGTPVIFPRISFAPSLIVHGGASGIKILKGGAKVLLDRYLTVDVRGALGTVGFARALVLEGENNGLAFNLGLEDVEGFGIAVGATHVTLE